MKQLVICAILISLLLIQGCSSTTRDTAGRTPEVTNPLVASETAVIGSAPPAIPSLVPEANGGSSLPASAPYRAANGTAVQQNINPAPFMVAAGGQGAQGGTGSGAALITSGSLTSRADGTMSGPNDQPAAGTGWETQGPQQNPAAASAKPAAQPPQKPPK